MSAFRDAVKAAVVAAGVQEARVHDVGAVPSIPATPYVELSSTGFLPVGYTIDATHGLRDHMVTCRVFDRATPGIADYLARVSAALLDQFIVAESVSYGPGRQEQPPTPLQRDPDAEGLLGVFVSFKFMREA